MCFGTVWLLWLPKESFPTFSPFIFYEKTKWNSLPILHKQKYFEEKQIILLNSMSYWIFLEPQPPSLAPPVACDVVKPFIQQNWKNGMSKKQLDVTLPVVIYQNYIEY